MAESKRTRKKRVRGGVEERRGTLGVGTCSGSFAQVHKYLHAGRVYGHSRNVGPLSEIP